MRQFGHLRLWGAIAAAMLCALPACIDPKADSRITQIQELQDKLAERDKQLASRDAQLAQQAATIQKLQGLGADKRLDDLVHVDRIAIERLSGGYDDNHDAVSDGIVVYLSLYDREGDVLKASGSASFKAFDLTAPNGAQLVAEGKWDAVQLRSCWYGKFMTSHYTLKAPWQGEARTMPPKSVAITAQFVDLLSGRTFEAQHTATLEPTIQPAQARP